LLAMEAAFATVLLAARFSRTKLRIKTSLLVRRQLTLWLMQTELLIPELRIRWAGEIG
jgi:hypothetical protein